ncbi:MAG: MBL fold metallo-hydrolase [Coprobacillus sp.]|nr:MBL fold metallo-hydrolase [Coprobacillus sp.]
MIFVFLFFSLWIGLVIRYHPLIFISLALVLLIYLFKKYSKKLTLISLCILSLGVGYSFLDIDYMGKDSTYSGVVIESKDNYFIFYTGLERLYVSNYGNTYEVGDILSIQGEKKEVHFISLESEFDFDGYLNKKGVNRELEIGTVEVKLNSPFRLNKWKANFLSKFEGDTASFINALFFSGSSDSELSGVLETLHLSRFASASGIYIYAFLNSLTFIFSTFMKKRWAKLLSYGVLFPYFILLFPRFTIIRISTLYLFRWVNEYPLHKRFTSFEVTSIAGMFFLIVNRHLARQDSFILGFALPFVSYYVNRVFNGQRRKAVKKIGSTFLFGVFFIPFEVSFYSSVGILTYFLTLLFTPFFTLLSFMTLLCYYHVPLYGMVNRYTSFLNRFTSWFTRINYTFYVPKLGVGFIIFFIFLFMMLLYFMEIRHKPMMTFSGLAVGFVCLFTILPFQNYVTSEVTFINVGQGDAALVRIHNTSILIDTGGIYNKDVATDVLIPFLHSRQIYSLDYVMISHDDSDHNGALESLCSNFTVRNVIDGSNAKDLYPLTIEGVTFYNYNQYYYNYGDDNDQSIVLGFNLSGTNYLFMGDATTTIEKTLMNNYNYIPCDILKVGHHGSSTSTSDEFIEWLSPKTAVISVGEGNRYGHPTDQVLTTLTNYGVEIRRTDLEGSIRYLSFSLW